MKNILILITVCCFYFGSQAQCKVSNANIHRIVKDYYQSEFENGSICVITVLTKNDTTFYEITTIGSLRVLFALKLFDYYKYRGRYLLIENLNCKTYKSLVDNKRIYSQVKRYLWDDITVYKDENGNLRTDDMLFDPDRNYWFEYRGILVKRVYPFN